MFFQTISPYELRCWMETARILIIDINDLDRFDESHLPGAINITLDERFEDRMTKGFPNRLLPVVVYGNESDDQDATLAASMLDYLGYENVRVLEGGKQAWMRNRYPIQVQPPPRILGRH